MEPSTVEIRLHGRGGQGGVTCAKILASTFAHRGKSVQAFGDYAGERAGAPIRAFTRVSDAPIEIRNKVYQPDHLVVLDRTLLTDELVAGLKPGGSLVLNSPDGPEALAERFPSFRVATIDATRIARAHGIGTRSVVIVNTTLAGALAKVYGLPVDALTETYKDLGLTSNLTAAKEAFEAVRIVEPKVTPKPGAVTAPALQALPKVLPLEAHVEGLPTGLKTGSWRSQLPRYQEHPAPCSAFCPAGNDVIGFVQALAQQGEAEAAKVLGRSTPLASVCGRVCPAPCMDGCNRRELDGSVDVRGLERWVSDHVPVAQTRAAVVPKPKRVAVVGAGPAGLSAAYQLALEGQKVTLFEAEAKLGGVLRTGIPTYRLPRAALDREIQGILSLGVDVVSGAKVDATKLEQLSGEFDAVVLATGLQKSRRAEGEGGSLQGVEQGLDFLRRVNLEGNVTLTGHVVVLGGGNTAMDCARSALRCGAAKVTVAYRRTREEMPAIAEEIEQAHEEGIEFAFLRSPVGFEGKGRLSGVRLAHVALGPADASGRRSPVLTDTVEVLPCDVALLALGQSADLSLLPKGWTLENLRVHHAGAPLSVWAAGDVATGDGTVTHAIGSGRHVAGRVLQSFGVPVSVFERPDRTKAVAATEIRFDHFERQPAHAHQVLATAERRRTFAEADRGLGSATEAQRCFSCGQCTRCDTCLVYCPEGIIHRKETGEAHYEIDAAFCKGCGICVTECPRRAMEMNPS